jgi:hypothetical protein
LTQYRKFKRDPRVFEMSDLTAALLDKHNRQHHRTRHARYAAYWFMGAVWLFGILPFIVFFVRVEAHRAWQWGILAALAIPFGVYVRAENTKYRNRTR